MKAKEFEDILRLYLIENNLGSKDIESKCGDFYQVSITYTLKWNVYTVTQKDNYDFDDDIVTDIKLEDILLFIATY